MKPSERKRIHKEAIQDVKEGRIVEYIQSLDKPTPPKRKELLMIYGWAILIILVAIGLIFWFGIHPLQTANKCEEIAKLDYNMSEVAYCFYLVLDGECLCAEEIGTQIQKEHSTQIIHKEGESITFKIK